MRTLIFLIIISLPISTFSQVGIGTEQPENVFHIDAAENNEQSQSISKYEDDFIFTKDGKLGLGNHQPVTKLDMRNDTSMNIIGIGVTDQSASQAAAGAVQYFSDGTTWGVSVSDGNVWTKLPETATKVLVNANKPTAQNISANKMTTIVNWDELEDTTESFDPVSGEFTAPRSGNYIVTVNLATASGAIPDNSHTEVVLESTASIGVPQFRCTNSFPGYTSGTASNSTGNNCTGIFRLNQGDKLVARFYHSFATDRNLSPDAKLNTLTISEL